MCFAKTRVWKLLRLGVNDGVDCAVLLLQEFVFNTGQETERAPELSLPGSHMDVLGPLLKFPPPAFRRIRGINWPVSAA
jgi:hypothetical protein